MHVSLKVCKVLVNQVVGYRGIKEKKRLEQKFQSHLISQNLNKIKFRIKGIGPMLLKN